MNFNSGWSEIATKIERFINGGERRNAFNALRVIEEGLMYSSTVRNHKWANIDINEAVIQQDGGIIHITGGQKHNEVLGRSLVGVISEGDSEMITLSEVRRWTSKIWIQANGINIYEMGQNRFLFEFPSKIAAKNVLKSEWYWKKEKIKLQWWNPMV